MYQCKLRLAVIEAYGKGGLLGAGARGRVGAQVRMGSPLLYAHQLFQAMSALCTQGQQRYLPLLAFCRLPWALTVGHL